MKVISSYKVKMLDYNHIFDDTVAIYRKAVAFFLDVCEQEWTDISVLSGKERNNYMEHLTLQTKKNPNPAYDFNQCAYKMPAYLRRTAIQEALGAYSSYASNHENWVRNGKQGKEPKLTYDRNIMPTLYKGNMFIRTGSDTARVKVYHRKDWVWVDVYLCKHMGIVCVTLAVRRVNVPKQTGGEYSRWIIFIIITVFLSNTRRCHEAKTVLPELVNGIS